MELLTGFLIGIFGSFHCVGMCGPIALALPKNKAVLRTRLLYNIGRVITYSILGLIFGLLGSRLQMFGLQQGISITLGVIIIIMVFTPQSYRNKVTASLGLYKAISALKQTLGRLLNKHTMLSMLGIGMLNGLLPCGFVYIGITGAIAIGTPIHGASFMLMFGLGTLPIMLVVSMLGGAINISLRQKLMKLVPAFTIVLAVLFILRGLNLGVPFVSPKLEHRSVNSEQVICH